MIQQMYHYQEFGGKVQETLRNSPCTSSTEPHTGAGDPHPFWKASETIKLQLTGICDAIWAQLTAPESSS